MPAFWASRINEHVAGGVKGFIAAGRNPIEAKFRPLHGQFKLMVEPGFLRISQRTAQKLMLIAGNGALANTNSCSYLPPAIDSLVALAKLEAGSLQQAIDEKHISPGMTIAETRSLVSGSAWHVKCQPSSCFATIPYVGPRQEST